jgi:hypothetical protein
MYNFILSIFFFKIILIFFNLIAFLHFLSLIYFIFNFIQFLLYYGGSYEPYHFYHSRLLFTPRLGMFVFKIVDILNYLGFNNKVEIEDGRFFYSQSAFKTLLGSIIFILFTFLLNLIYFTLIF